MRVNPSGARRKTDENDCSIVSGVSLFNSLPSFQKPAFFWLTIFDASRYKAWMLYKNPVKPHFTPEDMKGLRACLNITQQEFANLLGVSRSTVARREDGSLPITRETELAVRFLLVSEHGIYHFPWRNKEASEGEF